MDLSLFIDIAFLAVKLQDQIYAHELCCLVLNPLVS